MEPATLSTTQHILVVQSSQTILHLTSVESATLSTTQQTVVCAIYADTNSALTLDETIYFTNNGHYGGGQTQDVYTNGVWRSVYGVQIHFLHFA